MNKAGVSILLRAGNNIESAKQFLHQLIKVNTLLPIEVVLLFNEPQANHLQLMREFAGKVSLIIRPAKGRTFANVAGQLRYEQILILTTPAEIKDDVLPKATQQLRNSNKHYLALKAPGQALLIKHARMSHLEGQSLTAAPKVLQQALDNKPSARQQPKVSVAENAVLDQQIHALEQELEKLDQSLSTQYREIDELDIQYEKLQGEGQSPEEIQRLKAQLKERVFNANDTLKTLKSQHDELERLRIRRYSIVA